MRSPLVALDPHPQLGDFRGIVAEHPGPAADGGGDVVAVAVVVAFAEVDFVSDDRRAERGVDRVVPVQGPVGLFDVDDGHLHALIVTDRSPVAKPGVR